MNKEEYMCTSCGKITVQSKHFYNSYSRLYKNKGKMPICKDCVIDIFEEYFTRYNDDKKSVYYMCRAVDSYFDEVIYDSAVQQALEKSSNMARVYFQKINSLKQYEGKAFDESIRPNFSEHEDIDNNRDSKDRDFNFEVTSETVHFWGKGFEREEYKFLDNEYSEYTRAYECDTPAMERLLQQASYESLEIRKKRENRQPVDKHLKNLQDILGSANIKPVQETGANASDQSTFGTLIKKWENEKPIPDPLPEWKEKDILEYVKVWFLGHLSKMIGLNNPFSKNYDDELEKHSVETPFEDETMDGE